MEERSRVSLGSDPCVEEWGKRETNTLVLMTSRGYLQEEESQQDRHMRP